RLGAVGILVFFAMGFGMRRIAGFGEGLLIDDAFVDFFIRELFERILVVVFVIVFAVEMRMFVLVLLVGCGKIGLFDVETGFDLTFGDVIAALVVEEIFVVVRLGFGVGLILDRLFAILGRNFLGRARGSFGLIFGFEFFIGDNGGAGL